MAKNYFQKVITSIKGNRLGLSILSSGETGTSKKLEFLVGPDALRWGNTTAETTSTNLSAVGLSRVDGSSAASSSVFTLDPPIPGIEKLIYFGSTGDKNCYVKTANSETLHSSRGSSFTTVQSTIGGCLRLVGVTTAIWGAPGLTSGTSSQSPGFALTTST